MKHTYSGIKIYSLLVIILMFMGLQCFSQTSSPFSINESPLPKPSSPVMDYSGVLDAATKQSLEKKVIDFRDQTNPKVELAVAIVDTTGDRDIFDYSLAVARGWGIGSKDDDNPSALLFIAIKDHKYFTQISKDLEDELPDSLAGQLQSQNLVPAFKQGDYGKGISDTLDAYIRVIKAKQAGEPVTGITNQNQQTNNGNRNSTSSKGNNTVFCLIILFVLLIFVFGRFGRGGRGGRGGGWGGGGFGSSAVPWIVGSILSNSLGSSSSSSWGGGSSSGSGSSWGGFGGGGDFGGGGAGGSW